jgi:hypothetical protein
MCEPAPRPINSPERKLARLFERDLEVHISPASLRMFIRCNWRLLKTYGHAIHEAPDE